MEFNDKEVNRLLICINERIITLRDEATTFKQLKETASKSELDDDIVKLINSCDKLINSHQQEYSDLISIRTKLIRGEENDS